MKLGWSHVADAAVTASLVIVAHVLADRPVCLHEALKAVFAITVILQYRMEGFNMGVHVRRLDGNTLMNNAEPTTGFFEGVGDKLWPVVRPYYWQRRLTQ